MAVDPQPLDAASLIRRKRRPDDTSSPDVPTEHGTGPVEPRAVPAPPSAAQQPPTTQPPQVQAVVAEPHAVTSRAGEGASTAAGQPAEGIRMKPREAVSLAVVHARVPEHIARGLKLMSVMEGRQAQQIVAEALEGVLNVWNPRWREVV